MAMNLGELKALLAGMNRLPDDTPVIIQKDSEGNGYSPLAGGESSWYVADNTYSGEAYPMPQDENDDQVNLDDAVTAVVLWPVN